MKQPAGYDDEDDQGSSSTWWICRFCKRLFPQKHKLQVHHKSEHLEQIRANLLQKRGQCNNTSGGQRRRAALPGSTSSTINNDPDDDVYLQKAVSDSVSIPKFNASSSSKNVESSHEKLQENVVQVLQAKTSPSETTSAASPLLTSTQGQINQSINSSSISSTLNSTQPPLQVKSVIFNNEQNYGGLEGQKNVAPKCKSCKEIFAELASFKACILSSVSIKMFADSNNNSIINLNKSESRRTSSSNFLSLPHLASHNNNNRDPVASQKVTETDGGGGGDKDEWTVEFWRNEHERYLITMVPVKPTSADSDLPPNKCLGQEIVEVTAQYMPPPSKKMKLSINYPKPTISYTLLSYMALKNAKSQMLPISEIYKFICHHFPYFKTRNDVKWKLVLRRRLVRNSGFSQLYNVLFIGTNVKGRPNRVHNCWAFSPTTGEEMDRLLLDKIRKNRERILASMSHPQNLHLLAKGMLNTERGRKKVITESLY